MSKSSALSWLLPIIALLAVFSWALNFTYPLIGHDTLLFFPKLLAGKWHFVRQGFAPFRFSPHFCAGLPVYGNPQDLFYSLPQVLTLVLDPWVAIQASILVAMTIGYAGWYFFSRDVLLLERPWAHLLALIIISNGSYLLHMIVGHFTFHTYPLLGLLLWILFDRRGDTWRTLTLRTAGFALTCAYALYAGYPLVLVFLAMAWVLFFPLNLLLQPRASTPPRLRQRGSAQHDVFIRLRTVLLRTALCGGAALLLGASKLVAVYSYMRFFPRLSPLDRLSEDASTLLFIARAFFFIPQGRFLFAPANPQWGVQEYSAFLSPVVLMGLLCGLPLLWRRRGEVLRAWKRSSAAALLALAITLFFVEMTRGEGLIAGAVGSLPLFKSLHAGSRYLYLFGIFVSAAAVLILQRGFRMTQGTGRFAAPTAFAAACLTVAALPVAYVPLLKSAELGNALDYAAVRAEIQTNRSLALPVLFVQHDKPDLWHVLDGTTAVQCFEPMFGYHGESFYATTVVEGPTDLVRDGAFNLQNPACFQYPEENGCAPGDRIAVTDRGNFENFRQGLPVPWKLSRMQHVGDWASLVSLAVCIWVVTMAAVRCRLKHTTTQ